MSNKFKLDKAKLLNIVNIISFRDKLYRRILKFSPDGLTAFENSSSSAFAIVECPEGIFEDAPDSEIALIVSDGFKAGLSNMGEGIVNFSIQDVGQGKQTIRMEEIENGVEKTTYEEPLMIPVGDESEFPIETGESSNRDYELRMKAPRVLIASIESAKLQSLHKSNIERYRMVWKPDGTLFVTTEIRDGGVLKKTMAVEYISAPSEEVKVDIEPMLFQRQLASFTGDVIITVHVTDTVRGITMTQRVGEQKIGYTLMGMNPI